jgi:hypothetical protein
MKLLTWICFALLGLSAVCAEIEACGRGRSRTRQRTRLVVRHRGAAGGGAPAGCASGGCSGGICQ